MTQRALVEARSLTAIALLGLSLPLTVVWCGGLAYAAYRLIRLAAG